MQDLNARLFDASGSFRLDLWRVAWHDAGSHPLGGSGAGSYAAHWFRERPLPLDATNAHELYLETLAELGPLGLGLLLSALGAPLLAAWRARRHPLMAGVLAAYVAFLVHVAADWDWQLAAVGLAGLACGAALLVMARDSRARAVGPYGRAALAATALAFSGFALWSLHGAYPLGQAQDAVDNGQWVAAESHARKAIARVGGSSAVAWQLLGEAQTALSKPERCTQLASCRRASRPVVLGSLVRPRCRLPRCRAPQRGHQGTHAESARRGDALVGEGGRNHPILAVRFPHPRR